MVALILSGIVLKYPKSFKTVQVLVIIPLTLYYILLLMFKFDINEVMCFLKMCDLDFNLTQATAVGSTNIKQVSVTVGTNQIGGDIVLRAFPCNIGEKRKKHTAAMFSCDIISLLSRFFS